MHIPVELLDILQFVFPFPAASSSVLTPWEACWSYNDVADTDSAFDNNRVQQYSLSIKR